MTVRHINGVMFFFFFVFFSSWDCSHISSWKPTELFLVVLFHPGALDVIWYRASHTGFRSAQTWLNTAQDKCQLFILHFFFCTFCSFFSPHWAWVLSGVGFSDHESHRVYVDVFVQCHSPLSCVTITLSKWSHLKRMCSGRVTTGTRPAAPAKYRSQCWLGHYKITILPYRWFKSGQEILNTNTSLRAHRTVFHLE